MAINTSGDVWLFCPVAHKGRWRGKKRVVAIGPKAQALLARFTPPDPAEYYFSPRRVVDALHAARGEEGDEAIPLPREPERGEAGRRA